ncbi:MAG: response regulator [Anaerolineae bacterium]
MAEQRDTVFVIDPDEQERAVIVEAALEPSGYNVRATGDGNEALSMLLAEPPDVLVLALEPRGLCGQDILVALQSQNIVVTAIIIADQGGEREALRAFRLGAKDYILRPVREAELVQTVERALRDVRMRRERATLISEVRTADAAAEQRLREIKTLMGIGKSVAALQDSAEILDRVVRAAMQLTRADAVGAYVRDDDNQPVLRAGQNLSRNLLDSMDEVVHDDLATLVMNSQETYRGDGDGLKRFKPAQEDVNAVIYAPMVVNEQSIGVIWVANSRLPFEPHMTDIMRALADYGAIAVFNAHLFTTMQERSDALVRRVAVAEQEAQESGASSEDVEEALREFAQEIRSPLTQILGNLSMFKNGELGAIPPGYKAAVDVMHRQVGELVNLIDSIIPPDTGYL